MNRKFLVVMLFMITSILYSFEEGFIWGLRANFNGSLTLPSISQEDLDKMGAASMKGAVGYTMDGEAELGYLFGAERWFGKEKSDFSKFSGMSLYVSIGVGTGFSGMVSGNTIGVATVNVFMNVNYKPVISFGIGSKLYLLESRMAIGLQLGGKVIADTSPEYLAYSDSDSTFASLTPPVTLPEMGELIVTDFMKKNMNPVMFSIKLMLEYNQPINDRVEVVLGIYTRFNIYKPKYITMPTSLLGVIQGIRPSFTAETPMPTYYINSLDFGLTLGLQFRG
ncbi:hypothetical protein [Brachyspira aalborgi]|uniref:Uncharacterized protein n=1 Tax=Brachyspira aalborgi TaxID=29522 RepID=A0A5C8ER19_9SPIR|nr:hypothetical protein [Brachyspira aalborgi]TXJ40479.1 hypothetical protein EPJ81_02150 [Brachyspira aalborgi]CCY78432.1 putative uncharacterized protein [Brachyspira sp. CAG:700]